MQLPPEIRAHIVHQLSHHVINDWFIWEKDRYGDIVSEDSDEAKRQSPLYCEQPDFSELLSLRLVSHAWNVTASRFLRERCWWSLDFNSEEQLRRSMGLCKSQQDALFRKVSMKNLFDVATFQRVYEADPWTEDDDAWEEHPSFSSRIYQDQLLPREDGAPPDFHVDKFNEHGLIRDIFANLREVSAFHISFPPAFTTVGSIQSALCYDLEAIEEIFLTLQVAFKTDAFQNLVDLRLDVPSTRDVGRLADGMTMDAYHRLKHLRIHIMDETGRNGASGFEDLAPNNLQMELPNEAHQDAVWSFVASCPNLESLGIKGTHFLDLGKLHWRKKGLLFVSLRRIWASTSSIIELLGSSDESELSLVEVIDFEDVEMSTDGGNWSQLFIYLGKNCPNLVNLRIFQLKYLKSHRNFNVDVYGTPRILCTKSRKDWKALRELKRHLVAKAGGNYPQVCNAEIILDEDVVENDLSYGLALD